MKVTDVFSWKPAKEICIEELEQVFREYFNGTYAGKYKVSMKTPDNAGKNVFDVRAELIEEGRKVAYILEDKIIIAVVGYSC
ncbi:hypothetical protein D3Z62_05130 [Lachnospiraceae bacterium]|nr:hypothetical protein [Lachnospiraceae bacterium]